MFQAVRTTVAGALLLAMLTSAPTTAQIIAPVTPVVPVVPIGPIVILKPCVPSANSAAYLVAPAPGDTVKSLQVTLRWCPDSTLGSLAGYSVRTQIHLSRSSTFAAGAEDTLLGGAGKSTVVLSGDQDSISISLPSAGAWYWRVRKMAIPNGVSAIAKVIEQPWTDTSRFVSAPPGVVLPIAPIIFIPNLRIVCRNDSGPKPYTPNDRSALVPGKVRFQWCLDSATAHPIPAEAWEIWEIQIVRVRKPVDLQLDGPATSDTIQVLSRFDTALVSIPDSWSGLRWRVRKSFLFGADPWSSWSQATLSGLLSVRPRTARLDGFRPTSASLVSASGRILATYSLAGNLPESATLAGWSRNFPSATFVALEDQTGEMRTVPLRGFGLGN